MKGKLQISYLEIKNDNANFAATTIDQSYEMEMVLNDSGLSFSSLMSDNDLLSNLLEMENNVQLHSM